MLPLYLFFFGDSNLYGMEAETFRQYSSTERFSEKVITTMKKEYPTLQSYVDGRPGRSLKYQNLSFGIVNGKKDFDNLLSRMKQTSNSFHNILILSISINDILSKASPLNVITELKNYIISAKEYSDVLLLIPPTLKECQFIGWQGIVNAVISHSIEYVSLLKESVEEWKKLNIIKDFIDLTDIDVGSDGVHYTVSSHDIISVRLIEVLHSLLSQ